jgi:ABC-2 type transport system permease protein
MTTTTTAAPAAPIPTLGSPGGSTFGHLLKAEYLKIRTTNIWWLLGIFTVLTTGLALLVNILQFHNETVRHGNLEEIIGGSASIFTSGQFFGAMFALLLATLTITNEYHHQTVTTTFLATPHRTSVIMAKFVVSMLAAGAFWLFTTIIDLIVGSIYFSAYPFDSNLGNSKVIEAMLLSLLVFALWAVFGVGLGVLMRSQIAATLTGTLSYSVGYYLAIGIFVLIRTFIIERDGVLTAAVIVPAIAAQVAISPVKTYPQSAAQWVGVAVMIGYGLLFGAIGIYFTRKRDVS